METNQPPYHTPAVDPALNPEKAMFPPQLTGALPPSEPNAAVPPAEQPAPAKKFYTKPLFWVVVLVVILGGGVAAAAANGITPSVLLSGSPSKIWQSFLEKPQNDVYHSKIAFSYTDDSVGDTKDSLSAFLKNIKFSFSGNGYVNNTDENNIQSQSELQYSFSSGNSTFSTGFSYKMIGKDLYVNLGDNPLLSALGGGFGGETGEKHFDWIKVSLDPKAYGEEEDFGSSEFYKKLADQHYLQEIADTWEETQVLTMKKFVGKEDLGGVATLHYQVELNKDSLKTVAQKVTQAVFSSDTKAEEASSSQKRIETFFNALITKLEVKEFDIWVGRKDNQVYKVHIVSNAPSVRSLGKGLTEPAREKSADAKRLVDMRQMVSAFELYYNDTGGYPPAKNGIPDGVTSNYLGVLPAAPPRSGTCTDYYNNYWYAATGTPYQSTDGKATLVYPDYELTTCLGNETGGYQPGVIVASKSGLTTKPCTDALHPCTTDPATEDSAQQEIIDKIIAALDFSAQITIDVSYFDYGKVEPVEPPSEFLDLQKKLQDEKRVSAVRSLTYALQSYFYEHNTYPEKLIEVVNDKYLFMDKLPTAPTPPGGSCTEAQNAYTYTRTSPTTYTLTFCLGEATQGYTPGVHTATQTGIQ